MTWVLSQLPIMRRSNLPDGDEGATGVAVDDHSFLTGPIVPGRPIAAPLVLSPGVDPRVGPAADVDQLALCEYAHIFSREFQRVWNAAFPSLRAPHDMTAQQLWQWRCRYSYPPATIVRVGGVELGNRCRVRTTRHIEEKCDRARVRGEDEFRIVRDDLVLLRSDTAIPRCGTVEDMYAVESSGGWPWSADPATFGYVHACLFACVWSSHIQ
jgi:hypothetical protein